MDLLELMKISKIDKAKAIGHSSREITIIYASSMAPEKFEAVIPVAAQNYFSEPVRKWIKSGIWEEYFGEEELDLLHGREKSETLKKQFYGLVSLKGEPALSHDRL